MNSITNCLDQLQGLTQRNLEILQAINDAFFTKQDHISVNIGENNYAIPSFISLENKINYLQENFNNLINAPKTGEAYFNMDGNSRAIEVRGYTHTPNSIVMQNVNRFNFERNNIFKDFLSPMPYINVDLSQIPNDITSVNIKKIIPKNQDLIDRFKSLLGDKSSSQYRWADLYKILILYKKDVDYIEYDSIKKLPIKKNIGQGNYIIKEIVSDVIDDNLEEYVKIKLHDDLPEPFINNLSYRLFDETIYKSLSVGDELVTFDDSAKMQIIELDQNSNSITVKILNGEFLNLGQTDGTTLEGENDPSKIDDVCKIKFYSPIDFDSDKYIRIALEEDQYIYVAVAPLNDRMNIQSPWGTGLFINTYNLLSEDGTGFEQYYDENVRNIGDTLYEMTFASPSTVNSLTFEEFNTLINTKPIIDTNNLNVVQINNHLNNSPTIQNIRSLYSQKMQLNAELTNIQNEIARLNKEIDLISMSDTSGELELLIANRDSAIQSKNEKVTAITKIINEISLAVNNSEIPIENAKYHIRGFFDYESFASQIGIKAVNHIKGIQLQYRYKNINQPQGNAQTISDKFLYSDWNIMEGFLNPKLSGYNADSGYYFYNQPNNDKSNEPSFNQIDVAISQGETVDLRLKIIYDYGFPFSETSTVWSDIVNIQFPDEFLKEVPILTIIEENNNDIETNRFNNILKDNGIIEHVDDKFSDQGTIYFHSSDKISSGFYTEERRVIPLKEKLASMDNLITLLSDEIMGASSESLTINLVVGDVYNQLFPYQTNNIGVESYEVFVGADNTNELISEGTYSVENNVVSTVLNLIVKNTSTHTVKLYSMFPGSRDKAINNLIHSKFNINDYTNGEDKGVWIKYSNLETSDFKLQTANQFITFRLNDVYTGEPYYKEYTDNESGSDSDKKATFDNQYLSYNKDMYTDDFSDKLGARMYPSVTNEFELCLDNDSTNSYLLLNPNDQLIIPIIFEYKLKDESGDIFSVNKTMSFDLRTSLYNDPLNYTFKVTAKLNNTTQDKLITTNRRFVSNTSYNTTVTK